MYTLHTNIVLPGKRHVRMIPDATCMYMRIYNRRPQHTHTPSSVCSHMRGLLTAGYLWGALSRCALPLPPPPQPSRDRVRVPVRGPSPPVTPWCPSRAQTSAGVRPAAAHVQVPEHTTHIRRTCMCTCMATHARTPARMGTHAHDHAHTCRAWQYTCMATHAHARLHTSTITQAHGNTSAWLHTHRHAHAHGCL